MVVNMSALPPADPMGAQSRSWRKGFFSRWFRRGGRTEASANGPAGDGEDPAIIAKAARFGSLRVDDVMVPRADIVAINEEANLDELLLAFDAAGHSRLPVYRETLDDPVHMVHIKDLLGLLMVQARAEGGADAAVVDWSRVDFSQLLKNTGLGRNLLFVPASMPASALLIRMQATRIHLALVIDEYGGTDGLVSIEDLVEEIVGEIEDEHDDPGGQHTLKGPDAQGCYEVDARVEITVVEAGLNLKLTEANVTEGPDTLGGLIFSMLGRIPVRGEIISHPSGIEFSVADVDPRRIRKILIHRSSVGGDKAVAADAER